MTGEQTVRADPGWYRHQTRTIGMITPSANIVVERVSAAVLASFPEVSAHFSRTTVKGSHDDFPNTYDWEGMLGAARLLGDAKLDVICWNGSKAGSIGFDIDRELCRRITADTGIPATSSTLAIEAVLKKQGFSRIALVTPYAPEYQAKILKTFRAEGLTCVAEEHAGVTDNLRFAFIDDTVIAGMMRSVARFKPDAIIAYCTNFPAAHLVGPIEAEVSIPIYDSVSIGVWQALRTAGVSTGRGAKWGSLYTEDVT
jgi:maleate isomerase